MRPQGLQRMKIPNPLTSSAENGIVHTHGELSERFKEPVLKTGDGETHREFESHTLRQKMPNPVWGWVFFNGEEIRKVKCGADERRRRRLDGAEP